MKSLNTTLGLSALAIAMIASPAFAQQPQSWRSYQHQYWDVVGADGTVTYPDPVARSGDRYPNPAALGTTAY